MTWIHIRMQQILQRILWYSDVSVLQYLVSVQLICKLAASANFSHVLHSWDAKDARSRIQWFHQLVSSNKSNFISVYFCDSLGCLHSHHHRQLHFLVVSSPEHETLAADADTMGKSWGSTWPCSSCVMWSLITKKHSVEGNKWHSHYRNSWTSQTTFVNIGVWCPRIRV